MNGFVIQPNVIAVYTITCTVNRKVYVGSSKDVFGRMGWHSARLRSGKHNRKNLLEDFALFSEKAFQFAIVSTHSSIEDARAEEAERIIRQHKLGLCYNVLLARHYTPQLAPNAHVRARPVNTEFDSAAKLKNWMEANGMRVADLRIALGCSRYSAYRVMWGGLPSDEDMRSIFKWTSGEVTPNDFYDVEGILARLASAPHESEGVAA